MYDKITEAPWFQWNPKLAATVAAQLEKSGRLNDAETLISDSVSKLTNNYRDLMLFYCSLIESSSSHYRVHHTYAILTSSSFQAAGKRRRRRRGIHESMVKALCNLNSPIEAEDVMMNTKGFHPSAFEFRLVSQAYGRSGRFDEMLRVLTEMEKQGFLVDTICSNIVLSCYGDHKQHTLSTEWMKRMRISSPSFSSVSISIRTFNVVLNSCDTLSSILLDLDTLPLSFPAVISKIHHSSPEEAAVVSEIHTRTPELLTQLLSQGSDGCKLDLHGCHLSTAYMVLMEWIEEMRMRFEGKAVESYNGGREEQDQVTVVCGGGKHSNARGDSPLRKLVSKMMYRMSSPLRLDKKNNGRFISKSQKFKSWITNSESQMTIN